LRDFLSRDDVERAATVRELDVPRPYFNNHYNPTGGTSLAAYPARVRGTPAFRSNRLTPNGISARSKYAGINRKPAGI
jgi:hypothetical protein